MLSASFLASRGLLSAIIKMAALTAVFCHAWHQWHMQKCVSGCGCVVCNLQGHLGKSQNLAFLVLTFKKCKILRFHDLIAKMGITK
jgi:hypothetical protein